MANNIIDRSSVRYVFNYAKEVINAQKELIQVKQNLINGNKKSIALLQELVDNNRESSNIRGKMIDVNDKIIANNEKIIAKTEERLNDIEKNFKERRIGLEALGEKIHTHGKKVREFVKKVEAHKARQQKIEEVKEVLKCLDKFRKKLDAPSTYNLEDAGHSTAKSSFASNNWVNSSHRKVYDKGVDSNRRELGIGLSKYEMRSDTYYKDKYYRYKGIFKKQLAKYQNESINRLNSTYKNLEYKLRNQLEERFYQAQIRSTYMGMRSSNLYSYNNYSRFWY